MSRMWTFGILALGLIGAVWAATEERPVYLDTSVSFENRAADLVERMTLEEKISQVGDSAAGIERLGVLPYNWWNECLHGVARAGTATVFPQAIGLAATFDRELMYETACVISDEARAKHHEALRQKNYGRYYGLTFWSPNINIFRDPRWGRGHETYGEDPYLTGQMGIEFVRGLQGDDPKYLKLVATAKHFAVHSGPESERHHFNAIAGMRDLWETYLPAFYDLVVEARAYSVMGAYNRVDGESASASWMLLEDILRKQWGFEGYVVSDCGAIHDIYANHKIVETAEQAATLGVRRGCDLNCGSVYQRSLEEAVAQGIIDEGEIDLVVYRLMLARMKLGMFDPPSKVGYAAIPYSVNDSKEHDAKALETARKSMTLLKNDGLLPLDKGKIRTIAVVGPNADSVVALRGNYYGEASHPVTVLEGIRQAAGDGVEVLYARGCPLAEGLGEEEYAVIDSKYLFTTDETGKEVHGLRGEYFTGTSLQGRLVMTRVDRQIRMNWGGGSPTSTEVAQGILIAEQGLGGDKFSIRWKGKLLAPVSGVYQLGAVSDDGCRVFLDGKKIVDGWSDHAMTPFLAEVTLEAGRRYDLTVEYYENVQDAGIQLVWTMPGEAGGRRGELEQAIEIVRQADAAIFVGGLDAELEGEEMRLRIDGFAGGDRTRIELPAVQTETLKALQATGKPVVFVLLAGSSIAMPWAQENLPAILLGWYPGQRGGSAVADVLFGDCNPAGRLPVTFYTATEELGDFRDYNMREGKGKTYRYYRGEPLYAFGHGLSFTAFEYSKLKISRKKADANDTIKVSVEVTNTGERDGEEVVQLYVRDVESSLTMPVKQLRGFERVAIPAGKKKTVSFTLKPIEDMRYYDAMQQQYAVEPGEFEIQVGASSADVRVAGSVVVED